MQDPNFSKGIPWPLITMMLLFIVPLLAAILLFRFHDRIPFKYTHTGQLISPPISSKALDLPLVADQKMGKWQLVYLAPKQCGASCNKRLEMLNRIHQALGKDQHRVCLHNIPFTDKFSPIGTENAVLIIDPQGLVMMVYPATPLAPKGVLQDLRRLLRFSHG